MTEAITDRRSSRPWPPPLFDRGRRVSATTAIPATSSGSSLWGVATIVLVLLIEVAEGTNDGLREDLGDAAGLVPRAVRQLALGRRPGRRRCSSRSSSPSSSSASGGGDGSIVLVGVGGRRCRGVRRCSTAPSGSVARCRSARRRLLVGLDALPVADLPRRSRGRDGRRQAVAGPGVAAHCRPGPGRSGRDVAHRRDVRARRAAAGRRRRRRSSVPPCSSSSVRRTGGRARWPSPPPSPMRAST